MAIQRRGVVLLVEENGQYRLTQITVTASSHDEAIQRSTTALALMNPWAKVVWVVQIEDRGDDGHGQGSHRKSGLNLHQL